MTMYGLTFIVEIVKAVAWPELQFCSVRFFVSS
ncbi:hypothetical protein ALP01_200246 [Pseudomonas caricapapayae]|nr:hypothetical protein ALP01_200246 [Pseudomonas caricapapayae]